MNYPLYNKILCPDIWVQNGENYTMSPEVRERLMEIATDFIEEYLKEAGITLSISDVVVIGSIANYNWNKYSDIDLHIVFDYSELDMSEEDAFTLLTAVKINWNKSHDIKIKNHDLELGVQGLEQKNHSKSEYSVKNSKWITPPTRESPKFDKETIKKKHKAMQEKIVALLKDKDDDGLRKVLEKLYIMRQAGLDKGGEYSAENIVFKILRAQGYLDKIKDHAAKIYDKEMTLSEGLIDDAIDVHPDSKGKISWVVDTGDDLVPTDDENGKRFFTHRGIRMFGAYRFMPNIAKDIKADHGDPKDPSGAMELARRLRTSVKHPMDLEDEEIIDKLIEISINRMSKKIDLSKISVAIPLGSTSDLNKKIAKKIKNKYPNITILDDYIKKVAWKDVRLSDVYRREMGYEKIDGKMREGPRRAAEKLRRNQENNPDGEFQIHRVGSMGLRRYFSYFYKTDDTSHIDANKKIAGSSVLIIDDTLEEGITFDEAVRNIKSLSPKEIVGYIFLWGKQSKV